MKQKAEMMWDKGRFADAIGLLEQNLHLGENVNNTLQIFKAKYKEQTGGEYEDEEMRRIERFAKWAKTSGVQFNKIGLKQIVPGNRGIYAMKPVFPEERILTVPEKLIITEDKGRDTELGKLVAASGVRLKFPHIFYLTLLIMEELNKKDSIWRPYMDVYPKTASNFPVFYTKEEKSLLIGTSLYPAITRETVGNIEEYNSVVAKVPELKKFSVDDFIKYTTLTVSRQFAVDIGSKKRRMIVPLADMFNYIQDKSRQTYWSYSDEEGIFFIKAKRNIPSGEDVRISNM